MEDSEMASHEDSEEFPYKPSYVLVAVDTHRTMFETDGAPSPFKNAMKALYRLSDELLLKSDKRGWSPFAIVLHDKDERASLVNFKENMIKTNKLMKAKSSMSEESLRKDFMRDYDVDLASFFQLCKKKFKEVSSTFYKRIMIFITDDHDPVNGDSSKRFTALNEAKNFEENDITFQLVVTKEDFKFEVFYNELFSLLKGRKEEIICEDEEGLYDKLTSTIWFRHTQRKLLFYPFADDPSKYTTVFMKSYIKKPRLLNNDFVATDGTPLKRLPKAAGFNDYEMNREYILEDRGSKRKFEEIKFDLSEKLGVCEDKLPVGLTLLYVSKRLSEIGEVISEPKIIEADSGDDLPFFNQFWQYCVNNEKVLVCARKLRIGTQPKPVELIPKFIEKNKVFLMKQIPYANEKFESPVEMRDESEITDEQKEVTDMLIEPFIYDFSVNFLLDEEYLRKEKYVKAKLLDEPRGDYEPTPIVTTEEIDEKIGLIINKYSAEFPPEQGTKRKHK